MNKRNINGFKIDIDTLWLCLTVNRIPESWQLVMIAYTKGSLEYKSSTFWHIISKYGGTCPAHQNYQFNRPLCGFFMFRPHTPHIFLYSLRRKSCYSIYFPKIHLRPGWLSPTFCVITIFLSDLTTGELLVAEWRVTCRFLSLSPQLCWRWY